jgi:hypothetical protein
MIKTRLKPHIIFDAQQQRWLFTPVISYQNRSEFETIYGRNWNAGLFCRQRNNILSVIRGTSGQIRRIRE